MQSFVFVNREENYIQKLPEDFKGNTNIFENPNLTFIGAQSDTLKNKIKEDQDFQIFILGNPVFLSSFDDWWSKISCSELFDNDKAIFEYFNRINGISALLLLQKKENKIQFVIDPLGYFPLYIFELEDHIIFTDQLKYIYFLEDEKLEWDLNSMKNYLDNGHFLSGRTWFKNVRKAMPAARYFFDTKLNFLHRTTYWTWESVLKSNLDKNILLDKYVDSFKQLFDQFNLTSSKIGIALSGGLDSRWSAWYMSKKVKDLKSFTFSVLNSLDSKYAKKVSESLNLDWNHYVLDEKSGLRQRLELFWRCDGMVPIQHFHEGDIHSDLAKKYDIVVTGFYGGGIYARENELNKRVNHTCAHSRLKFNDTQDLIDEEYFNITNLDPYISYQKISNLAAIQLYQMSKKFKVFLPFYNMSWLNVNYSIEDSKQVNSKFYLEALNNSLSEELLSIPWQKTILPLKYIQLNVLFIKFRIDSILKRLCNYLNLKKSFINYNLIENEIDLWIKELKTENSLTIKNDHYIEGKLNYLSVLLWMKMCKEKKCNVI